MSVFRKLLSLCVAVLCVMSFTACSQSGSSASSFPTDYGFSVQLPESVQENIRYDLSNREVGDETINTINVVYEGETGEANILTFEEMSSARCSRRAVRCQSNSVPPRTAGLSSCTRCSPTLMKRARPTPMRSTCLSASPPSLPKASNSCNRTPFVQKGTRKNSALLFSSSHF